MGLQKYHGKRDFSRTKEPRGKAGEERRGAGATFVVQKHAARRLHYDFRLELDGVLLSWAVPKGPSLDPSVKRLAMQTEDHPLEYASFEGTIPKGQYGGGAVLIWDAGTWEAEEDARAGYAKGHLKFRLFGKKLSGSWHLVRTGKTEAGKQGWLLFKSHDEAARSGREDVVDLEPLSVASGRSIEQIAGAPDRVWHSNRAESPEPAAPLALDPAREPGARKVRRLQRPEPQLATLADTAPDGDGWLHELKFDGYRLELVVDDGEVSAWSRNGKDWTARVPSLVRAIAALGRRAAIFDGELVVLDARGISDFQALQNALGDDDETPTLYYAFDLLHLDGYDLTRVPLERRKALLRGIFAAGHAGQGRLRYSDHVVGSGTEFFEQASRLGLEGIVSKRRDRPYVPGRSKDWLKTKCTARQEFVIGGFSDPAGSRGHLGALLLGSHEDDGLRYAGKVGTGFSARSLAELHRALKPLVRARSPFVNPPTGAEASGAHWVEPKLVAEVEFAGLTRDGRLRHPSFRGLRSDKPAREVHLERAEPAPGAELELDARFVLTNAERVLYPEDRITKRELVEYYVSVAEWLLPHVSRRVLTLLRCPEGHTKHCFFQKHPKPGMPEGIHKVPIEDTDGVEDYLYIRDLKGLLGVVQLGTLEIHTWGAHFDAPEKPDQLVIDLDPDEGLGWEQLALAAQNVRERLADLGLTSFVKTTGGKGLHVVLPIERRTGWDDAKEFCRLVAVDLARREPKKYVASMSKRERRGRIFVDYLRNGRGATAVAAYSTRARAGAPVSTPLGWDELGVTRSLPRYTIRTLPERLRTLSVDPWAGYAGVRQSITKRMAAALTS